MASVFFGLCSQLTTRWRKLLSTQRKNVEMPSPEPVSILLFCSVL
jgi:hypothetical protein